MSFNPPLEQWSDQDIAFQFKALADEAIRRNLMFMEDRTGGMGAPLVADVSVEVVEGYAPFITVLSETREGVIARLLSDPDAACFFEALDEIQESVTKTVHTLEVAYRKLEDLKTARTERVQSDLETRKTGLTPEERKARRAEINRRYYEKRKDER